MYISGGNKRLFLRGEFFAGGFPKHKMTIFPVRFYAA
jgi:hypothetical protein